MDGGSEKPRHDADASNHYRGQTGDENAMNQTRQSRIGYSSLSRTPPSALEPTYRTAVSPFSFKTSRSCSPSDTSVGSGASVTPSPGEREILMTPLRSTQTALANTPMTPRLRDADMSTPTSARNRRAMMRNSERFRTQSPVYTAITPGGLSAATARSIPESPFSIGTALPPGSRITPTVTARSLQFEESPYRVNASAIPPRSASNIELNTALEGSFAEEPADTAQLYSTPVRTARNENQSHDHSSVMTPVMTARQDTSLRSPAVRTARPPTVARSLYCSPMMRNENALDAIHPPNASQQQHIHGIRAASLESPITALDRTPVNTARDEGYETPRLSVRERAAAIMRQQQQVQELQKATLKAMTTSPLNTARSVDFNTPQRLYYGQSGADIQTAQDHTPISTARPEEYGTPQNRGYYSRSFDTPQTAIDYTPLRTAVQAGYATPRARNEIPGASLMTPQTAVECTPIATARPENTITSHGSRNFNEDLGTVQTALQYTPLRTAQLEDFNTPRTAICSTGMYQDGAAIQTALERTPLRTALPEQFSTPRPGEIYENGMMTQNPQTALEYTPIRTAQQEVLSTPRSASGRMGQGGYASQTPRTALDYTPLRTARADSAYQQGERSIRTARSLTPRPHSEKQLSTRTAQTIPMSEWSSYTAQSIPRSDSRDPDVSCRTAQSVPMSEWSSYTAQPISRSRSASVGARTAVEPYGHDEPPMRTRLGTPVPHSKRSTPAKSTATARSQTPRNSAVEQEPADSNVIVNKSNANRGNAPISRDRHSMRQGGREVELADMATAREAKPHEQAIGDLRSGTFFGKSAAQMGTGSTRTVRSKPLAQGPSTISQRTAARQSSLQAPQNPRVAAPGAGNASQRSSRAQARTSVNEAQRSQRVPPLGAIDRSNRASLLRTQGAKQGNPASGVVEGGSNRVASQRSQKSTNQAAPISSLQRQATRKTEDAASQPDSNARSARQATTNLGVTTGRPSILAQRMAARMAAKEARNAAKKDEAASGKAPSSRFQKSELAKHALVEKSGKSASMKSTKGPSTKSASKKSKRPDSRSRNKFTKKREEEHIKELLGQKEDSLRTAQPESPNVANKNLVATYQLDDGTLKVELRLSIRTTASGRAELAGRAPTGFMTKKIIVNGQDIYAAKC